MFLGFHTSSLQIIKLLYFRYMKHAIFFLIGSILTFSFLQTSMRAQDAVINPETQQMMEAMKQPEKLKGFFHEMKNNFTYQGFDQSGPFQGRIELSDHIWDSIETVFVTNVLTELAAVYGNYFSDEDIRVIRDFYTSSTGQKWLDHLPEIQNETSGIIRSWLYRTEFELAQLKIQDNYKKLETLPSDCSRFQEGTFIITLADNFKETFTISGDTVTGFGGINEKYKIEWINSCTYSLTELLENSDTLPMNIEINIYEVIDNSYRFLAKLNDGTSIEGEVLKVE